MADADTRVYSFEDEPFGMTISVTAHKRSCFFCEYCTEIIWDYTNGPYVFFCGKEADTDDGVFGRCPEFKEKENEE